MPGADHHHDRPAKHQQRGHHSDLGEWENYEMGKRKIQDNLEITNNTRTRKRQRLDQEAQAANTEKRQPTINTQQQAVAKKRHKKETRQHQKPRQMNRKTEQRTRIKMRQVRLKTRIRQKVTKQQARQMQTREKKHVKTRHVQSQKEPRGKDQGKEQETGPTGEGDKAATAAAGDQAADHAGIEHGARIREYQAEAEPEGAQRQDQASEQETGPRGEGDEATMATDTGNPAIGQAGQDQEARTHADQAETEPGPIGERDEAATAGDTHGSKAGDQEERHQGTPTPIKKTETKEGKRTKA